jgi:hypothetical protein
MDDFWDVSTPIIFGGGVSALVACLGAYFGYRLQRAAHRRDRMESAAATLMAALGDYEHALDAARHWGNYGAHLQPPSPHPGPAPVRAVTVMVQLLIISSNNQERKVARRIEATWRAILDGGGLTTTGYLVGAISDWRTGQKSGAELDSDLSLAESYAAGALVPPEAGSR